MRYAFTRTAHVSTPIPGRRRCVDQQWRDDVARGSYEAMQAVARLYGYTGPQWSPSRDGEQTDRFNAGGFWYDIEEVPESYSMPMTHEDIARENRRYWREVEADQWRGFTPAERFTLESQWAGACKIADENEADRRMDR